MYCTGLSPFYHEFKKQIAEKFKEGEAKPNVAMTFSFGNENDPDNIALEVVDEMFEDYANFTGISFTPGNKTHGEAAYFEDVTDRAKRGGSGRNPKNIDILIVADQLLTGYDSKRINTLYVDRRLELQGLIQAYSRTNRVYGSSKEFGTIINFQYPRMTQKLVRAALELYGSGGKNNPVIVTKYEGAVDELNKRMLNLIQELSDPTRWIDLRDDKDGKKRFKAAFKEAAKQLNVVKQYYEFVWDNKRFGLDEHKWLQYVGAYRNLFPRVGEGPEEEDIRELQGRTKLQGSQVIGAQSLIELIGNKTTSEGGYIVINDNNLVLVLEQIKELSNLGEHEMAESLKRFVNEELVGGHIPATSNFDEAFQDWQDKQQFEEVKAFASEWGIDADLLSKSLKEYSLIKPEEIPFRDDISKTLDPDKATNTYAGNKLMLYMKLGPVLQKWMRDIKQKYKH